ncbi:hypothetical protein [Bacillus massilinigeriensis]|uniref:hypothetical protein n=1 Tax=Bacillus mediterraneensis TaxID=1805474 RepID=UPI0008F8EC92|nr:hypothetical protein [Bacillus mediterraneensis]
MGRYRREEVGGVANNNFKVKFHGYIDGADFCRAVRRCVINDLLVAGAQDNENDNRRCHCKKHRR